MAIRGRLGRSSRNGEPESCTSTGPVRDSDLSAMCGSDRLHDRQSQPSTASAAYLSGSAREPLENPLAQLLINSGAPVGDGKNHGSIPHVNRNEYLPFGVAKSVVNEVDDGLLQPQPVSRDRERAFDLNLYATGGDRV